MTSFIFDDVIYRTACILVAREFFVSAGDLVSVFANLSQNEPFNRIICCLTIIREMLVFHYLFSLTCNMSSTCVIYIVMDDQSSLVTDTLELVSCL